MANELTSAAKLQKVREWIVGACADVVLQYQNGAWGSTPDTTPLGIAEVLRASAKENIQLTISQTGWIIWWTDHNEMLDEKQWYLSEDNLDHQKPEVIDFLFALIP